jgi:hypothetical protein
VGKPVLAGIEAETKWADLSKTLAKLIQSIDKRNFSSEWKSTFKKNLLLPVELI